MRVIFIFMLALVCALLAFTMTAIALLEAGRSFQFTLTWLLSMSLPVLYVLSDWVCNKKFAPFNRPAPKRQKPTLVLLKKTPVIVINKWVN